MASFHHANGYFALCNMIQVIQRALNVMSHLARTPDESVALGDIAQATRLNAATCARILQTLVHEGYVDQEGRRKGYRLGPMAYALTSRGPYRKDLVTCAEPVVRHLAKATGETALVAILHRHKRFTLCRVEGGQDVQVRSDAVLCEAIYPTPTGRLLLAHMSADEVADFVAACGLPDAAVWPEAQTRQGLLAELAALRTKDTVTLATRSQLAGVACPIRNADRVTAALGLYLPASRFTGAHKNMILKEMKTAAEQISLRLTEMHNPSRTTA